MIKRLIMGGILIAIALVLVWFCSTNSSRVHVSFFLGDADIAVFLVIVFSVALGFFGGVAFFAIREMRRRKAKARKPLSRIIGDL